MEASTSSTQDSRSSQEARASIAFVGLVVVLMLLTGAFTAWAVNWIVAEVTQTIRDQAPGPEDFTIQVVMPTPTPRIATPTVGSAECKLDMICETPKRKPEDCNTVKAGGQPCTFTGFTGDAEDETTGSPEILYPPGR